MIRARVSRKKGFVPLDPRNVWRDRINSRRRVKLQESNRVLAKSLTMRYNNQATTTTADS